MARILKICGIAFGSALVLALVFITLLGAVVTTTQKHSASNTAATNFGVTIPTISPLMYYGGGTRNARFVSEQTKLLVGDTSTSTDAFIETPSLAITDATPGGCLQLSSGHIATTTGSPCSSGSGLPYYASSTIGSGVQAGGLTISGGSTTTLDALFQRNLRALATTTLATTTASLLNGVITVDGVNYLKTGAGIQAAANNIYSLYGGGTVFLPCGTYLVSNPLDISTSTSLVGEARDCTILLIDKDNLPNFSFSYIITPKSSSQYVEVRNLTLDGDYDNLVSPSANQGGLLIPGDHWTIENVVFDSSNYFMTFPNNSNYVTYRKNIFRGNGRGSDCFGGGGNTHMLLEDNIFEEGIDCNAFDNVRGSFITARNNKVFQAGADFFLEGMTDSTFEGNYLYRSGLIAETEAGYSDKTYITNPRNLRLLNNTVIGGDIAIKMSDHIGHASALSTIKGGNNLVQGNYVENAGDSCIWMSMSDMSLDDDGGNQFIGNTTSDCNMSGDTTWNTGNGISHPSGINIMKTTGATVIGNTIIATSTPLQRYGIEIGQTFSPGVTSEPNNVTVSGNNCVDEDTVLGCFNLVSPTYTTNISYLAASSTAGTVIGVGGQSTGLTVYGGATTTKDAKFLQNIFVSGTSGSRIGVGTTSPDSGVHINGYTGSALLHVGDSTTNSSITRLLVENRWTGSGQYGLKVQRDSSSYQFGVEGNGNVGVATSTAYGRLSVNNTASIPSFIVEDSTTPDSTPFIIDQSGNVGIGTSSPGSLLSLNGIANFTTATSTFYSTGGLDLAAGCFSIAGNCLSLSNLSGTAAVGSGGTGATSFGQGWIYSSGGTTALAASTSPTVNYITSTSTTDTNVFKGGLSAGNNVFTISAATSNFLFSTTTSSSSVSPVTFTLAGSRGNTTHGFQITDSSSAGANATINVSDSNTNTNWASLVINSARRGIELDMTSTSNTKEGVAIDYRGRSSAISISQPSNTALDVTGINISTTNVGGGKAHAALFTLGDVGVGTTTPWGLLSASSTSVFPALAIEQKSTGPAAIFLGGNVGVGTVSPSTPLHVVGQSTFTDDILTTQSGTQLNFQSGSAVIDSTNGSMFFKTNFTGKDLGFRNSTNGVTFIHLFDTGKTGIGTTTPWAQLSASSTSAYPALAIEQKSTGPAAVFSGGSIGIGTTSPWRTFSVNGTMANTGMTGATGGTNNDVCITTAGDFINETTGTCVVSSKRFKHDIKTLDLSALQMVNSLRTVSFTPNDQDVADYKDTHYGLIAEEVAAVDPHLVRYGTDGLPRTLDDFALISLNIKAVQELSSEVDSLKGGTFVAKSVRSAEENWQWIVIGLLAAAIVIQQIQLARLKGKKNGMA